MQNVEKWSNIFSEYCGVNSVRFFEVCLAIFQHYA